MYLLYEVTNLDDREKVTALKMGDSGGSSTSGGTCYQTQIMSPSPFNGNGGELIQMADGSIWQESSYQYLYLYEYYPTVTICPDRGQMILNDNIFQITRVRLLQTLLLPRAAHIAVLGGLLSYFATTCRNK